MSVRNEVVKKLRQWADKARDEKTRQRVKAEVLKRLKQGKQALLLLQKELNSPANRRAAAEQVARARAALQLLKSEAKKSERKVVAYTKNNPEKALILAVAVGAAVGALRMALRRKPKLKLKRK